MTCPVAVVTAMGLVDLHEHLRHSPALRAATGLRILPGGDRSFRGIAAVLTPKEAADLQHKRKERCGAAAEDRAHVVELAVLAMRCVGLGEHTGFGRCCFGPSGTAAEPSVPSA